MLPQSSARSSRALAGQYRRNVIAGLAGLGLTAAVSLVFTPYLVSTLGTSDYGLWALGYSIVGFTIILDFGLLATIRRYQSRAITLEDSALSNSILGTSLLLYTPIGVVGMLVVASGGFWIPVLVDVAQESLDDFRLFMGALGVSILVHFVRSAYAGILFGGNRIDMERALAVVQRLVMVLTAVVLLALWQQNLRSTAVALVVGAIVSLVSALVMSRTVVPGSRPRFSGNSALVRSMIRFGAGVSLLTLGGILLLYVPPLAVGSALGAEAVAYFAIAAMVIAYSNQLMQAVTAPLFPVATRYDVAQDRSRLTSLYVRSTRVALLLSVSLAGTISVFASDIMGGWINRDFAWTGKLVAVLAFGAVFRQAAMPGRHILTATRRVFALGVAESVTGVLSIAAIAVILAQTNTGLLGVTAALAATAVLFSGIIEPACVYRELDLPPTKTWLSTHGRGLTLGVVITTAAFVARWTLSPNTLAASLATAATISLLGVLIGAFAVLPGEDRRLIGRLGFRNWAEPGQAKIGEVES